MALNYGCTKPYILRRLQLRLNVDALHRAFSTNELRLNVDALHRAFSTNELRLNVDGPSAQTEFKILTYFFPQTWVPALGDVTEPAVCG